MKLSRIIPLAALVMLVGACASPNQQVALNAQERHSCAELGIDPGSDAFAGCVANLDASMFEANNAAAR
jgi:hypothetical protein